jgi:hypothetical protein
MEIKDQSTRTSTENTNPGSTTGKHDGNRAFSSVG